MKKQYTVKEFFIDLFFAIAAGVVVGTAYYFFQNSNGFAPGGVGGLATITYHFIGNENILIWSLLMVAFNLPIFILVSALINKKLGLFLSVYLVVQSFLPKLYDFCNVPAYSFANCGEDFNVTFAAIATGVISGFGFRGQRRYVWHFCTDKEGKTRPQRGGSFLYNGRQCSIYCVFPLRNEGHSRYVYSS